MNEYNGRYSTTPRHRCLVEYRSAKGVRGGRSHIGSQLPELAVGMPSAYRDRLCGAPRLGPRAGCPLRCGISSRASRRAGGQPHACSLQPVTDERRAGRHVSCINPDQPLVLTGIEGDVVGRVAAHPVGLDTVAGGRGRRDRERLVGPLDRAAGGPLRSIGCGDLLLQLGGRSGRIRRAGRGAPCRPRPARLVVGFGGRRGSRMGRARAPAVRGGEQESSMTRLVALVVLLLDWAAAAETLTDRAQVIDVDTIAVGGVHVRLQGSEHRRWTSTVGRRRGATCRASPKVGGRCATSPRSAPTAADLGCAGSAGRTSPPRSSPQGRHGTARGKGPAASVMYPAETGRSAG